MMGQVIKMGKARKNSIAQNIGHLFYSTAISSGLNALSLILLASYLEVDKYGLFSVALAFSMIMGYFTDAGLSEIVLREGSKKNVSLSVLISSYMKIRGLLLAVTFVIGLMIIHLANSGNRELIETTYYLIFPMVTGIALQSVGITFFQLKERMQYCGLIRIVSSSCLIMTLLLGVMLKFNPLTIFVLYGMSYLIAGILAIILVAKHVRINMKSEFHKGLLDNFGSFTAGGLLFVLLPHLGPIILEKTITLSEVGLFAVAYRIPQALQQIPFIVAGAYYPVLFKAFQSNLLEDHRQLLKFQIKLMSIVGVFLTIPFFHLSKVIVPILFGAQWFDAALPLKILSFLLLLQAISIAFADGLTTSKRQSQRVIVQAVSIILGIIFYISLSKKFGVTGAAYAGVLMEVIALIGFWFFTPGRWTLAKQAAMPYLVYFVITIGCTDLMLNEFPFLAAVMNLVLVLPILLVDREVKEKLTDLIQFNRNRKQRKGEKKQGDPHEH